MDARYRLISAILFAVIIAVLGLQTEITALIPAQYASIVAVAFMVVREVVKEYGQRAQDIA